MPLGSQPTPQKPNWVAKHPVLTAFGALLALGFIANATDGTGDTDTAAPKPKTSSSAPAKTEGAKRADEKKPGGKPTQAKPAPKKSAPKNESPVGDLGTKSNPVPLGKSITIDDYTVALTSVNDDAYSAIHQANEFNDRPSKGKYVLVTYAVRYNGDDEGNPWADLLVKISGSDAIQYETASVVTPLEAKSDDLSMTTLEKGGKTKFDAAFNISNKAYKGSTLFIEPTFAWGHDGRIYFKI